MSIRFQDEQVEKAHPFVLFTLQNHCFAFSAMQVREILRMQEIVPVPQSGLSFLEGVLRVRERILPVLDMRKRFGLPAGKADSNRIILVRLPKTLIGLVVDSVKDVVPIALKAIQKTSEDATCGLDLGMFSGIAHYGGRLVLLPDPSLLLGPDEHARLGEKKSW